MPQPFSLLCALSCLSPGAAKLLYGPLLTEGAELSVPAPLIAAWAGLLASAINCIPVGELDGGRVAVALLGRRVGLPGWRCHRDGYGREEELSACCQLPSSQ